MALHAFVAYLRYLWKAKGRHGTHSPFIYDLIGHVVLDKSIIAKEAIIESPGIPLKYENLISRIVQYYGYKNIVVLPAKQGIDNTSNIDMLLLDDVPPSDWPSTFEKYKPMLHNDSAVIVTGVHAGKEQSTAWAALTKGDNVKMAIDFYGLGMLLFKNEFKEKQHFILKY